MLKDCDIEAYNAAINNATSVIVPCRVELTDGGVMNAPITVTFSNGTPDGVNCSRDSVASVSTLPNPPDTDSSTWYDRTDFGDYLHTTHTHLGVEGPILAVGRASFLHGKNDEVAGSIYDFLPVRLQRAQECVIDICFADYAVNVSKGKPSVSIIRTQHAVQFQRKLPVIWPTDNLDQNTTYHCWRSPDTSEPDLELKSIYKYPDNYTEATASCGLWVDAKGRAFCLEVGNTNCGRYNWAHEISKRLTTNFPDEPRWFANGSIGGVRYPANDVMQRISDNGLETVMQNIATSLTNLAVTQGLVNEQPVNPPIDETLNVMHGHAGSSVTYVKARFQWMILPSLLEVAAIVLLYRTIRSTKKKAAPLWKETILALLFYGLKDDFARSGVQGEAVMTVVEMEDRAADVEVCLRMTEEGYGLARDQDLEQQRQQQSNSPTSSRSSTPQRPIAQDNRDEGDAPTNS